MTSSTSDSGSGEILASGGGHATAAGVGFEAQLGAIFACQLLAERPLDSRLGLGTAHIKSIRFETEAPVDDILIETDQTGYLFVQTKTTLTSGKKADSELGKTADQIVRLYLACERGAGKRGWDRPLRQDSDRILLALGPPTAFTRNLSRGLVALQATAAAHYRPQRRKRSIRLWLMCDGHGPPSRGPRLIRTPYALSSAMQRS
jgi:hypothetical protein